MLLALLLAAGPIVNTGNGITFSQDSSQATRRALSGKLSDTLSVKDAPFLAKGDGSANDANAINSAMSAALNTVYLPASSHCYNIGSTTISIPTGVYLRGSGMGGAGQGASCIYYTGSGCAILLESVSFAGISDVDVQIDSASATAVGICLKSTIGVAEFDEIASVSIRQVNATKRVAGQIGLWLDDVLNGVYWNTFRRLRFQAWDTSVLLQGGATQGSNENTFIDLLSWAHNVAYKSNGTNVFDNKFYATTCSRSDASLTGISIQCLSLGVDGLGGGSTDLANSFGNHFYGLVSDQGSPSVCAVIGTNSGGNDLEGSCESGGPVTDNNTTIHSNKIYDSVQARLIVGKLTTTADATIIGSTITGKTPGGSVTVTGGTGVGGGGAGGSIAFVGGVGDANQVGGNVTISSGNGGAGVASPGNLLIAPGIRQGGAAGGTVVIGPSASLGISGIRFRSSRVVLANKAVAVSDCAGAALNPNVSSLLDGSIFTCATAQTLTMPTAQGATGIVQNLPGNGTTTPPQVGDIFEFEMISTAAANFTLAAGTGGTIVGNTVVNNSSKIVRCRVTSVTASSETLSCYL